MSTRALKYSPPPSSSPTYTRLYSNIHISHVNNSFAIHDNIRGRYWDRSKHDDRWYTSNIFAFPRHLQNIGGSKFKNKLKNRGFCPFLNGVFNFGTGKAGARFLYLFWTDSEKIRSIGEELRWLQTHHSDLILDAFATYMRHFAVVTAICIPFVRSECALPVIFRGSLHANKLDENLKNKNWANYISCSPSNQVRRRIVLGISRQCWYYFGSDDDYTRIQHDI